MFIAGPPIVERAFSQPIEKEDLGGSHIHAHGSGVVDISDPIFNLTFQFVGGIDDLPCEDAADVDDSGIVDISDPIFNLTFQFVGGVAPPPVPGPRECGPDPTADDPLEGELGCELEKCPANG